MTANEVGKSGYTRRQIEMVQQRAGLRSIRSADDLLVLAGSEGHFLNELLDNKVLLAAYARQIKTSW